MCGEGGRSYLGRSAPRPEFRTEPAVRRADRGAEVSRGHGLPEAKARTVGRTSRTEFSHWPCGRKPSLSWPFLRSARVKPAIALGQGLCMEAIVDRDNLRKALAQVRRNKRASGVDGMSVGSRTAETA